MKIVLRTKYSDKLFEEVLASGAKPKKMTSSDFMLIELRSEVVGGRLVFLKPQVDTEFFPTPCLDIAEREISSGVIVVCGSLGEALKPYYLAKTPGPIQARFSVASEAIGILVGDNETISIKRYTPQPVGDWAYQIQVYREYVGSEAGLEPHADLRKFSRAVKLAVVKNKKRDGRAKYYFL